MTLLDALSGEGAQSAPTTSGTGDHWHFAFDLPIWLSGINGTAGVRGFTAPVNASFTDILQATDSIVGLGGRVDATYGNWIFYIDGLYMKLAKDNIPVGPASLQFISELGIANAGIMYQVGKWNLGGKGEPNGPALALAGGVGTRYMYVDLQLNAANGASRHQNQEWIDPLAVGQVVLDLDKHWQIVGRGDIGGGTGAQLTWSASATVNYQFDIGSKVTGAVKLGYAAVAEDYTNGEGNQKFTWDVIMHGSLISLEVAF